MILSWSSLQSLVLNEFSDAFVCCHICIGCKISCSDFFFSANALIMNDDCQSPLDVARAKGHSNVVRAIEVYSEFSV